MSERLKDQLEERAAEDLGDGPARDIIEAVEEMVAHPEYPCLGARSVFRRDAATLVVLDDLSDTSGGGSLDLLAAALARYVDEVDVEGDLVSFVACFREPVPNDERRGLTVSAPTPTARTSRSACPARRSSWSGCIPTAHASRVAPPCRPWCSTSTSSSSG